MTRALILGASGLVGKALVEELAQDPEYTEIIAISRRPLNNCPNNKVSEAIIDFEVPATWLDKFNADVLFICFGTTIKQAGSKAQMTKIDRDYPIAIAQSAMSQGVKKLVFVSSIGANPNANSFYLKLKGETEQALTQLNFENLIICRPSVLTGDRGQTRIGELIAMYFLSITSWLPIIKKYKPISSESLAHAMNTLSKSPCDSQVLIKENSALHLITNTQSIR